MSAPVIIASTEQGPPNDLFLESNFARLHIPLSMREKIRAGAVDGVEVSRSGNGVPILRLHGKPIYNTIDPLGVVKTQIDNIQAVDKPTIVVLFGLGLGFHAEQLERRFSCQVIVYEPNLEVLRATLGMRPLPLDRTLLVTDATYLLHEIQPRLQFTDRKIVAAAIPEYQMLFPEAITAFKAALEKAVTNSKIMENTLAIRSVDWVRHTAENIVKVVDKPPIDVLRDRFRGKPAILVSAGPSLDGNIAALVNAKGRALILCVNAAVAPLLKAGVVPDIVAVVEGLDLRAQLPEGEWMRESVLALTLNSFPGFFDLPVKQVFPIPDTSDSCSAWLTKAYSWNRYSSGGSVACTGFSILHALGCDPLILVGQDLAYTDGRSYSSQATFGRQNMRYDAKLKKLVAVDEERNAELEAIRTKGGLNLLDSFDALPVEAYGGVGTVYTVDLFTLFRSWFEAAASTWAGQRRLINATEGGARINGFEEMPLREAVERFCNERFEVSGPIETAVANAPANDISALAAAMESDLDALRDIIHLTEEGRAVARQAGVILELEGIGAADRSLRLLGSLENEIRNLSRNTGIIDAYVSAKVNRLRVERWQDDDEDQARQTANSLKRTEQLLAVLGEGAQELLSLFNPPLARLRELCCGS